MDLFMGFHLVTQVSKELEVLNVDIECVIATVGYIHVWDIFSLFSDVRFGLESLVVLDKVFRFALLNELYHFRCVIRLDEVLIFP